MNRLVCTDGSQAWANKRGILLVKTESQRYNEALQQMTSGLMAATGQGVFITANRPVSLLREALQGAGIDTSRIFFIDCVTGMTGILPPPEEGVMHIESPSMLEKIALRAEQVLRRMGKPAFLALDSLSTLAVYNGTAAVTELAHSMITRLRLQRVAAGLLVVAGQAEAELAGTIESLTDGTIEA